MGVGIGATITTLTNGTTANASDVMASLNNLNSDGISNDGVISTDGSGHITAANGLLQTLIIISPYLLINNITINSGNTNTYTCTGVGGIPSSAVAVFCSALYTPSAAGTFASITPHGTAWSNANYPILGTAPNGTNIVGGSFLAVLDGSGKIDVKANGGNLVGVYLQMYAYVN